MVRTGFNEELDHVRSLIKKMGDTTVAFVKAAVNCLVTLDESTAREIRRYEKEIDQLYRTVDEKCVAIIATQQPMASDLRFLISSIKIAGEIERIADYANNIAKRVQKKLPDSDLRNHYPMGSTIKIMGDHAVGMLQDAMRSYEENDANSIESILTQDTIVDNINRSLLKEIISNIVANSKDQEAALELHTAIRYIERVADRATNIVEDVFYMSTGFPYVKKI